MEINNIKMEDFFNTIEQHKETAFCIFICVAYFIDFLIGRIKDKN